MSTVVEELLSPTGHYKAQVSARSDALFEVAVFRWRHEIVPGVGEVCDPFWCPIPQPVTLVDTQSRARGIALELLRNASGEFI